MVPVRLFQMTVTWLSLSYLGIQVSAAITLLKSLIWSYTLSLLLVQNIRSTQVKWKPTENINMHKITERIQSNTILDITDDIGVIRVFVNSKDILIVVDTRSPFQKTPHSMILFLCEITVKCYQCKKKHKPLHLKTKCSFVSLDLFYTVIRLF